MNLNALPLPQAAVAIVFSMLGIVIAIGAEYSDTANPGPGDPALAEYFKLETKRIADATLRRIETAEDWLDKRELYRKQLLEMLGLQPLPKRTPLQAEITGKIDGDGFTVENVHFQSRPGLYVTGNLYLPGDSVGGKAPAILYVCGHARAREDDISFGNKTAYQHHGAWFARRGYVCLTIDTLQLGEIEGTHHGTHREGRWWWNARGYTPAGVEAWNCIRALDYLESRPEVDAERIGVTGRSGGGAYSWWISAIDERIKVSVPVAGIASLKNHVVDGCVEGHCDCMFHVNTYRWDFAQIAALVAPRPLLIANTDKDRIFPLDGVVDVYNQTRRIYRLLGAEENIGLCVVEGPHKDTQPLRVPAFHWFERFLKGRDAGEVFELAAVKFFEPAQLKVFEQLPADEKNTVIDESFTVAAPPPPVAETQAQWQESRDKWMRQLAEKSFRGWPQKPPALALAETFSGTRDGIAFSAHDFTSQEGVRLRLFVVHRAGIAPQDLDLAVLNVLDEAALAEFLANLGAAFPGAFEDSEMPALDPQRFEENRDMFRSHAWAMAYVCPRGIGPTRWTDDPKESTHIRRRFMLLGQTVDGMRAWDVRRAVCGLREISGFASVPLWIQSQNAMAGVALYASLFEPGVARLDLHSLPVSHRDGPDFLNVLRFLDMPQAVAMAAERSQVRLYDDNPDAWSYPAGIAQALGWDAKQFQVRQPQNSETETSQ